MDIFRREPPALSVPVGLCNPGRCIICAILLESVMPRQPRLDALDTLHHVMMRGIERTAIFREDRDRADFVARLAAGVGPS